MIRYFMIAQGQVQQVGFRMFCVTNAIKLNITGQVRNLDNGMVEIYAQSTKENLTEFIKTIKSGNRFIKVENLSIKEVTPILNETKFSYI